MRRYLADTFSMVVFSIAIGAFVELVIPGLTVEQTIRIRAAALSVSLLISSILIIVAASGRPYGIFLGWCRRLFGVPQDPSLPPGSV